MTEYRAAARETMKMILHVLHETAQRIEAGHANHEDVEALQTIASLLGPEYETGHNA